MRKAAATVLIAQGVVAVGVGTVFLVAGDVADDPLFGSREEGAILYAVAGIALLVGAISIAAGTLTAKSRRAALPVGAVAMIPALLVGVNMTFFAMRPSAAKIGVGLLFLLAVAFVVVALTLAFARGRGDYKVQ